jgi:hypothetical protein
MMTTVVVTTLTTLGDDWQLKDELVFKGGRDVIDQNQSPGNKSGIIKARYIQSKQDIFNKSKIYPYHFVRIFGLVSLSVEIEFLLIRVLLWKCIGGAGYISSHPLVARVIVCLELA